MKYKLQTSFTKLLSSQINELFYRTHAFVSIKDRNFMQELPKLKILFQ